MGCARHPHIWCSCTDPTSPTEEEMREHEAFAKELVGRVEHGRQQTLKAFRRSRPKKRQCGVQPHMPRKDVPR